MIPPVFDYHAPASVADAIALLSRFGDSAKVISGGQSLLPLLKLRLGQAEHLVDIGRIPGLEYIREEGGQIRIGGRTRESSLENSELVRAKLPILPDTAKVIAHPLVRNMATRGGNLAHGAPGNDHPAAMVTLGANNVFDRVRIALTNVGPAPVKCTAAENALVNKRPGDATIADAARLAGEACSPSADRRGSVEYKREMSRVLTARALRKAV